MSCSKGHGSGSCVCKILKNIANAQKDIIENVCATSCEKSISDLLGESEVPNGLDTVPILLYNKKCGTPFKGYGTTGRQIGHIVSSYYFRIKSISNDCCAVIELLRDPHDDIINPCDPTEQKTKHLQATGICISVEIDCFCHITCLPAIRALQP